MLTIENKNIKPPTKPVTAIMVILKGDLKIKFIQNLNRNGQCDRLFPKITLVLLKPVSPVFFDNSSADGFIRRNETIIQTMIKNAGIANVTIKNVPTSK